jgi:hypothetical protein
MTEQIGGLPFWELTFDADGDPDGAERDAFLAEVAARGLTDLVVFAHGWNNDRRIANGLFRRFLGVLAGQVPAASRGTVGLAGVVWPSQQWADEPIPDFAAGAAGSSSTADGSGITGAADLGEIGSGDAAPADPTLDPVTLAGLKELFPAAAAPLDAMAALLAGPETTEALTAFHRHLGEFSRLAAGPAADADDGEGDKAGAQLAPGAPRMLLDDPTSLFARYRDALVTSGVVLDDGGLGTAGFGDLLGGLLHGAKEALRQATFWQMKNRAGTVGRAGLGPLLGQLPRGVRVHLAGHSFGGRLVSFALAGLLDGPSPVRAVTLLQGAFSQFAFAHPLPFDAHRSGALAGMLARIDGPLVACFSEHDGAIGTFYPLASFAAQEDSAAAVDPSSRWGGIGANGVQGVGAALEGVGAAGARYPFAPGRALNIDASEVVRAGRPPTGAHSDIVHEELTWVVLAAGGLV